MSPVQAHEPIRELAKTEPGLTVLLRRHHIDPRFAGNLTLSEVCATHGIDLGELVRELEEMDRDAHFLPQEILGQFTIPELVGYVLSTHHGYLRQELRRLEGLLGEAARLDGPVQPHLLGLLDLFGDLQVSLEWHMREEERHLFPYYLDLVDGPERSGAHLAELRSLVQVFEAEEARVLSDLEAIRRKTSGFQAPKGSAQATRDLFHDLGRVETELHRHIHDENFILYPKVEALCRGTLPPFPSRGPGTGGEG